MSKAIYYAATTLDGYIADSDDGLAWLLGYSGSFDGDGLEAGPMGEGGAYDRFYETIGALVSGSTTYEFVLNHIQDGGEWPYSDRPYWVLSTRDLQRPAGAEDNVHVVSVSAREVWEQLQTAAGERDVWIIGGGNVASQFADEGLLDEVHVTVVPVVLGQGKPLFDRALSNGPLQLLGTTTFANGMVELRYAVVR